MVTVIRQMFRTKVWVVLFNWGFMNNGAMKVTYKKSVDNEESLYSITRKEIQPILGTDLVKIVNDFRIL